jgi:hypothetical protein
MTNKLSYAQCAVSELIGVLLFERKTKLVYNRERIPVFSLDRKLGWFQSRFGREERNLFSAANGTPSVYCAVVHFTD